MVVVKKSLGMSCVVTELDGSESKLRVAGFRLIPYFPCTSTLQSLKDLNVFGDTSQDDPEDVQYLAKLPPPRRRYCPFSILAI